KRAAKEIADLQAILKELESSIKCQLNEGREQQLKFWQEFGEEELDRNRDNLRFRLSEIPNELKQERERISRHYADPVPRLFPVAVMLLVPKEA
ncbi:MAG: hypothetical protein JNM43_01220, partial [Planctomycetaceae bacterium]|nr:hypothetical protein [Planctomycetaceae bacterium]